MGTHIARPVAVVAGVLLGLALVFAQTTPPGIPEALRIQASDPAAAAKILEGVTEREPKNARAWRLLGAARQQAGQLDTAIAAYQKATELGPDPVATYNIAVVHAITKDADKAGKGGSRSKKTESTAAEKDTD